MSALSFDQPPESLCILRLSAIGDVTHMLPVIATLQQHWPDTKITWIIGKIEYQLVKSLHAIEFIIFDKINGLAEYKKFRKNITGRHFDILLMMQVALRANLISLLINADIKIGYDKKRARDFHGLFCNQHIEGLHRVHVLDTFFQFIEKLGITERNMDWLLKAAKPEQQFAQNIIGKQTTVIINPCSSARKNNWRNWSQQSYAEIIDTLMQRDIKVILTGGPSSQEINYTENIVKLCSQPPINLVGKTTLAQLLGLLEHARCLIAPDTGPAHMGTVAGIPVIGLYASSNPERSGPYNSLSITVNKYSSSLQKFNAENIDNARWGQRVRDPDVMNIITADDVIEHINKCLEDE
ncbi:MAG: glycosyltransferase family 9 protein [Gammaproteobacteria bacterium]|nr:glycosyltransferase family 9 protein [Gammaproteobacteria bacterium]